ncbi:MAG: glycosyltransferase [Planctomycetes bacterium]|nr:glycosyltransferase [Planctomycetota bacterium]
MKIALTIHGFPPEHTGGTEQAVHSLAQELVRRGHRVLVLAGSDRWQNGYRIERGPDPTGRFEVVRFHRGDPHYGHWHKRHSAAVSRDVEALLARERPDVLHVHHWLRLTDDLVRIGARLGIPTVTTLHDFGATCPIVHRVRQDTRTFCSAMPAAEPCSACATRHYLPVPWIGEDVAAQRYRDWLAASIAELRASTVLTCLSRCQGERIATALGLEEAPHSIAPTLHDPPPRRAPRPLGSKLVLGAWGSIHELKGTDVLVAAVGHACAAGAAVELHIAGQSADPPFEARVREAAAGLPVHWHGRFEQLAGHPVADVDAFVSGTRAHETWGLVADEALALGVPVILPAAGAFLERFAGVRSALLYESGDAEDLGRLLVRLLRDGALRERFFAPVDPRSAPAPAAVAEAYERLYDTALARGPVAVSPPAPDTERAVAEFHAAWDAAFRVHYGIGSDGVEGERAP